VFGFSELAETNIVLDKIPPGQFRKTEHPTPVPSHLLVAFRDLARYDSVVCLRL
jgi:hypothetical protein